MNKTTSEAMDILQEKKELSDWKKNPRSETNPDGYWLHPEDVAGNTCLVEAMNTVIKYFDK